MYVCKDCGAAIEEPALHTVTEWHYEFNPPEPEVLAFRACPDCGSEDLEEGDYYIYCEEAFPFDELYGDCVCHKCLEEIKLDRPDLCYLFINDSDNDIAFAEFLQHLVKIGCGDIVKRKEESRSCDSNT